MAFYRGGRDDRGRTLDEIRAASDQWLEATHDYIQWAFPLPEPSAFNPDAPLLSRADITAFLQEAPLQERLLGVTGRMLHFYGLTAEGDLRGAPVVLPALRLSEQAAHWVTPGNHNFLRLSRILRSLALLGLQPMALAILQALEDVALTPVGKSIGETTLCYWREAATKAHI